MMESPVALCISTEIDFDFTLIGTNETGAKKLLAIPMLEIYPIESECARNVPACTRHAGPKTPER